MEEPRKSRSLVQPRLIADINEIVPVTDNMIVPVNAIRDSLITRANRLKEEMKVLHNLRCLEVDLDLEEAYQKLLKDYANLISRLRVIDPNYVETFGERCIEESKKLEGQMETLDALLQQYNDGTLQNELNNYMARHIRLLDQATIMQGGFFNEKFLEQGLTHRR